MFLSQVGCLSRQESPLCARERINLGAFDIRQPDLHEEHAERSVGPRGVLPQCLDIHTSHGNACRHSQIFVDF